MENDNFGQHLTLDLSGCNQLKLIDTSLIYDFLINLASVIKMNIITLPYVVKWLDPSTKIPGVSGFTMIAESHISIHTYPEKRKLYADIFSCRNFHINRTISCFLKVFEPEKYEKHTVKRGVPPNIKISSNA